VARGNGHLIRFRGLAFVEVFFWEPSLLPHRFVSIRNERKLINSNLSESELIATNPVTSVIGIGQGKAEISLDLAGRVSPDG
jgi:hypothetical protein